MNIAMIGTGYVGLTTGALFADRGNKVFCVDNNPEILDSLREGKVHFYEPGLAEIVRRTVERGDLNFTSDIEEAVTRSDAAFLAVGTPSRKDGSFDLSHFFRAAEDTGKALRRSTGLKIVVAKSTVPQRTWEKVSGILKDEAGSSVDWAYVSNPETLAEGTAVNDFSKPDRVIVGTESDDAFNYMQSLYYPFVRREGMILRTSPASAELSKLFANTHLAAKVALINEMARIADVTPGADMEEIRKAMSSDKRIGYHFMFPGPGYGGSCFPKDVQGVVEQSRSDGYNPLLISKIHESNEAHKNYMGERIVSLIGKGELKSVGVWGATFKAGTDDMRDAASIPIITRLVNEGARVIVYDPKAEKARKVFSDSGGRVSFVDNQYAAAEGTNSLILLTEWPQFDSPDYSRLRSSMVGNDLFDLRNRWQPDVANKNGFNYYGVGRNYPLEKK